MPKRPTSFRLLRASLLGALLATSAAAAAPAGVQVAAGRITDLQGRPIANALVKAESWESEPRGTAQTDAQGRFRISLSQPVKELTLIVERPGFQRWAMAAMTPSKSGYWIRLTRNIDRAYLTRLTAQTEPAQFREVARDLLVPSYGTTGEMPMQQVLPFLKGLRARLRALPPAEPAQVSEKSLTKTQRAALSLLAYLGDPRDDALVDAWAAETNFISRPKRPCRGATAEAAARAWQELHFEREGYRDPKRFPYNVLHVQIAPSGDHGLAHQTVRYASWAYMHDLVLVRLNGTWEVRRVMQAGIWHAAI